MRDTFPFISPTCMDMSDRTFPMNTSCSVYNYQYVDTYKKLWCGEGGNGLVCDFLEEFFEYFKFNSRIRDPHGCEKSCNTTEVDYDCLACQHHDFFSCQTTGICIHQSNVCDGHPPLSVGVMTRSWMIVTRHTFREVLSESMRPSSVPVSCTQVLMM